jgi:hypothetical protein
MKKFSVAQLNLRMSALLQVILCKLVLSIESAQWIFGADLFSSMLYDVTLCLVMAT